jgi:outer membrane protein OmpA-like peptidoglycan-associated protein
MKSPRPLASVAAVSLALAAIAASPVADAQTLSRFALRAELGAGVMTPTVQRQSLGYDGAHLQANLRLGVDALDWLSLQLSVSNGFFFASDQRPMGRTRAFQGGLRLQPALGTVGRLWADVNPGVFFTGDDRRFGLDAGLGFEFALGRAVALGPFARVHWVMADPQVHQPSDALFLSFGASLTLRVPPDLPPPAARDRDGDGVLDGDDACVEVPQGETPDARRPGCPRVDRDGDGVFDDEDLCVDVMQGAHPDPSRRGCPLPDTDADGVFDPDDRCVTTPQGDTPDATRPGCPDGDDDNDGVRNGLDQCRTEHHGLVPDAARVGCPSSDRDRDSVPDVADRCPDQPGMPRPGTERHGCPGEVIVSPDRIQITQPVFFATNEDVILARSFPVLTAVRDVLQSVPGIRRVSIEGHTDDVGDDASNLDLSNRRAASVVRWLIANGVAEARLEARGFGEARPLRAVDGLHRRHLRDARAVNRRVDFRIVDPPGAAASPPTTTPR